MNNVEDDDRTEWDAAWAQMEARDFPQAAGNEFLEWFRDDFGAAISARLSPIPAQYRQKMRPQVNICPVCRESTETSDDLIDVVFSPRFERFDALSTGARVHSGCYQKLPISKDPPPVLW